MGDGRAAAAGTQSGYPRSVAIGIPRIGFSYPISDKAKVYFNYGHFFQLPQFIRMFARNTSSVNQNDVLGNPNLDYQKTIQYSFGVKYAMSESYSIDLQGYFKDEFDKINSYRVLDGSRRDYVVGHWSPNFDLTGVTVDLNVVFPIERLDELAAQAQDLDMGYASALAWVFFIIFKNTYE